MGRAAQARTAAALKGAKARTADRRSRTAFTRTQSVAGDEGLTGTDEWSTPPLHRLTEPQARSGDDHSTMRGSRGTAAVAACVVFGALAVAVPGPAWSASHRPRPQRQVNTAVTGPLTIAWRGDPAHGCASAGLCGVSGTAQMTFGGESASSGGGPPELLANATAVARVQTTQPDGSVATCVDVVPIALGLAVHGTTASVATGFPGPGGLAGAPSSGRCAGPTAGDMAALRLPARRDGHGYDLTGHTAFVAGPFAVTAISGVRVLISFGSSGGSGTTIIGGTTAPGPPIKLRSALVEHASLTYRVIGLAGSLTTDFAGAAPPQCDALDACGVTGHLAQSFATRGAVTFSGARIVRRRVGRKVALADLRDGRMRVLNTFGAQPVRATVQETASQPGGLPCAAASSASLIGAPVARPRRGGAELVLPDPQDEFGFGGGSPDPFRTYCPGPATQDILGPNGGALATATVTAGQLGGPRLSITFRSHGVFHSPVYTGRRSGTVTLKLALVRGTGGTRRTHLFPGEPVLP